jgi:hypothetical protein
MILYKYLCPERLETVEENTFRFTQPNACNDPFECMPRLIIAKTPEGAEDVYDNMHNKYGCLHGLPVTKKQWIAKVLSNDKHRSGDFQFQKKIQDINSNAMGMLCLTKNPNKLLMWSHYSCNHTGFVLGIDSEHNWFSNPPPGRFVGIIKDVVYGSTRPEKMVEGANDNFEDLSYLYHKGLDWKYEEEYRYILPLKYCENVSDGVFVRTFPKDLIKSAVFGCRINPEVEKRIRKAFGDSNIDFLRAEPSSVTYEMRLTKA